MATATDEPYQPVGYPAGVDVDCVTGRYNGARYDGDLKRIYAVDEKTVVFELCRPDAAFLSKIASVALAVNDTAWLTSRIDPSKPDNQAIVTDINGTGPYMLDSWDRGLSIVMKANPNWRGRQPAAGTLTIRWSGEAAQRLVELQSGTVDGIEDVGPRDLATVRSDPSLQLKESEGLDVLYIGFNNEPQVEGFDNTTNPLAREDVRRAIALGIDRQKIVDQFYGPGGEPASHFAPCTVRFGCAGDAWYPFDPAEARRLLHEAGYTDGFRTRIQAPDRLPGGRPDPTLVATDLKDQLIEHLGIAAEVQIQEWTTFIGNADAGLLDGIHLLGWRADVPDITDFLDNHFGTGASKQFGDTWDDITAALEKGAAGASDEAREPFYVEANTAIREHVPVIPVAHGGSRVAYRADVSGNPHVSPLGTEDFAVMAPGDRTGFIWMQSREPRGLYCADEADVWSARVCAQSLESLYGYEVSGTTAVPALAEGCEPNSDLTVWTCTLRSGVLFANGATLDANDVVLSYAVQWDSEHALHRGRDNSFPYFPRLFGGLLNPAE